MRDFSLLQAGDIHGRDIIKDKAGWVRRVQCPGLIYASRPGTPDETLTCGQCGATFSLDSKEGP